MDSCQAPGRSCQHLNLCFPGKTEHFYWLRTKELCWEASALSFKNAKIQMIWHFAGAWHLSVSLFLNPFDFTISKNITGLVLKDLSFKGSFVQYSWVTTFYFIHSVNFWQTLGKLQINLLILFAVKYQISLICFRFKGFFFLPSHTHIENDFRSMAQSSCIYWIRLTSSLE